MLPSLPVSILYGIVILLSPACISNLAVSINQFGSCIQNWYSPFQSCLHCTPETCLAPSHWPPCSFYCGRPVWSVPACCTPHTFRCTPGTASAGGFPHSICMAVTVWSSLLELWVCHLLPSLIFWFYPTAWNWLMCLILLPVTSALLPSWPMPTCLHLLYGHHFSGC